MRRATQPRGAVKLPRAGERVPNDPSGVEKPRPETQEIGESTGSPFAATGATGAHVGGSADGSHDEKRSQLTVAKALRLTSGFVLLAFVAFVFASFLSVQSIDSSFDQVVSVDQPSGEAATDMIASADEATIAFLESLVSDKRVPSETAEDAFNRALAEYDSLVSRTSRTSAFDLSEVARGLFQRLRSLGRSLVSDDQQRRQSFLAVQRRLEDLDDTVEEVDSLSGFEGDVEENARLVSNYVAAPSLENKEASLEELDEFIVELFEARAAAEGRSERRKLSGMLADVRQFQEVHLRIIALTERSEDVIPLFLSTRSRLDAVLTEGIDRTVETSLERRSERAAQTVETSKTILIASLVLGVTLGLGAWLWIRKRITQPVGRLVSAIGGLGQAEESIETDLLRNDEFGLLARALAGAASQRRVLEEELRQQALHDPLTGLANRTLFKDRVDHALKQRRRDDKSIAVAFLDIDDFKTINDSLGHAAGDELLVAIGQRLRESVRTSDTPARLGGDEFAVLLSDVAGVADVAIPAQHILESVAVPMELGDKVVSLRGSVGIAIHENGQDATELLRNADVAMYSAKTEGKGRYRIFDEMMHSAAVQRFQLKNELVSAIDREEFRLHYQPVIDLTSGRKKAMEALLRWEHPQRGLIAPGEFVALAEETGAIVPISRWVLDHACAQAVHWRRTIESNDLRVCVNVSPSQLNDHGLVVDVTRALASSELPAEALVLEITENVFLLNDEAVMSTLDELASLGVAIAIDDFGSGYSSLGYLSRLPIKILKIDRSFVHSIDLGPEEGAVAQAIIRLGRALGLEIIAEGIETSGQLGELQRLECPLGQGFLLGRPSAPEEIEVKDVVGAGFA
jgi:diguanylate cyclase (GGDEF)-like protein